MNGSRVDLDLSIDRPAISQSDQSESFIQYPPRERAQISKLDHRISGHHNQQGKITSNEQTCEVETLYSDIFSGSMTFHFLVPKISAILATDHIGFGPFHMADTVGPILSRSTRSRGLERVRDHRLHTLPVTLPLASSTAYTRCGILSIKRSSNYCRSNVPPYLVYTLLKCFWCQRYQGIP